MSDFEKIIESNIIKMRRARISYCRTRRDANQHQRQEFEEWRFSDEACQLVKEQLKKLGYICPVCLRDLDEDKATIDHLDPLSRAYSRAMDKDNFLVMCGRCNKNKYDQPFKFWRVSLTPQQRTSLDYAIRLIHGEARLNELIE